MDDEYLGSVPREWHDAFWSLIETGEADPRFLAFLDKHEPTQNALEGVLRDRAAAFTKTLRELKKTIS